MWNVICSNRFLEHKMRQEAHRRHRNSIRAVKPLINIPESISFSFLSSNPKRTQLQQQHQREIHLANADLVRRMTYSKKESFMLAPPEKFSLNKAYSKKMSMKINKENQKFLERLRDTSSSINFSKLEKEHQLTQRIKENLSRTRPGSSCSKHSQMRPSSAR